MKMETPSNKNNDLSHERLIKLQKSHPTLRLLNAANAPLIISFLYQIFIEPNRRSIPYQDLLSHLDDYLYHLQSIHGEEKYPRSSKAYIEEWANDESAFLRKYYVHGSDDPELDLTPAAEIAIDWILSLEQRKFIGTESRLLTMFQLLKDIAHKNEQDPKERIKYLEEEKKRIETEISNVKAGILDSYDTTQIKERFHQAEDTAKRLLSDFRQVEYNFRTLDKEIREQIASSDLAKGKLLDQIFQEHDAIRDSDQGKSFRAFWEFLMSTNSQDELEHLLNSIFSTKEIAELNPNPFLKKIKYFLLEAGEKVYKTNNLLAEQLRKYLDDQAWLENKRIITLIKQVEKDAILIKDTPPKKRDFSFVEQIKAAIQLPLSRQLFMPPKNPVINDEILTEGSDESSIDLDILYQQNYIDEDELKSRIEKSLQSQFQISLRELILHYPITKGLAEIVGYLHIATKDQNAVIESNQDDLETLLLEDTEKNTQKEMLKKITMPKVIFSR